MDVCVLRLQKANIHGNTDQMSYFSFYDSTVLVASFRRSVDANMQGNSCSSSQIKHNMSTYGMKEPLAFDGTSAPISIRIFREDRSIISAVRD